MAVRIVLGTERPLPPPHSIHQKDSTAIGWNLIPMASHILLMFDKIDWIDWIDKIDWIYKINWIDKIDEIDNIDKIDQDW